METPRKADVRKFGQASGDLSLSDTVNARKQDVTKYEGETQMYAGFTDALMGRYANKLEADGKKQALIDAYDQSRKGEKMKPEEVGSFTSVYHKAYEEMSVKIYQNDLKIEADAIVNQYALQFKDDPAGFKNQMDLYVQKTEGEIPEYLRESWHQELQGLTAVHSRKIMENDLRNTREAYAASFVNSSRLLETQALNAADARNAKLLDTYITDYERSIDEAVTNEIMTPAQGEKLKIGFKAGVGEEFIMSHFGTFLDAGIDEAIAIQRQFAAAPTMGDRSGGSRSWRNRNPGNHKYGKFAKSQGAIGQDKGGFAIYPSEAAGRAAQANLLRGKSYADKNLTQMVDRYAPSSDNNNTVAYVNRLMQDTGIDPQKKMGDYSAAEMEALTFAMQKHEGWTPGETNVPWEYNTEERDAIAAKMERMIKAKVTANNAGKTALKSKNNYDLGNATKTYKDGGVPTNKTDLDILTDGEASYAKLADYKTAQAVQPMIADFNQVSLISQQNAIASLEDKETLNGGEQFLLDSYRASHDKNIKQMEKDVVSYVKDKVSGDNFKPLTSITNPANITSDLKGRMAIAEQTKNVSGGDKRYYTEVEAKSISDVYMNQPSDNLIQYVSAVQDAVGDDSKFVYDQLSSEKAHNLTMVSNLYDKSSPKNKHETKDIVNRMMIGEQLLRGDEKIPGQKLPTDFGSSYTDAMGTTLFLMPIEEQAAYKKAAQSLLAEKMHREGTLGLADQGMDNDQMDEVMNDLMGGDPIEIRGSRIIAPWRGASKEDFSDALLKVDYDQLEGLAPGVAEEVFDELKKPVDTSWYNIFGEESNYTFKSIGQGRYIIGNRAASNRNVTKMDGTPLIITLTKD